ncbi:MAG TPA: CocE/NonD family hydrolase [Polyangiaceae bacterium]|nr:CocE/NonD family hydrolase [Polyangiaceae bacterium]
MNLPARVAWLALLLPSALGASVLGCDKPSGTTAPATSAQVESPAPPPSGAPVGPEDAGTDKGSSDDVRIDFNQRVKMRDGVELSVDVYRPAAAGKYPVILLRTPYTKVELTSPRYFASRGYVFVAMDVRGRGDSDGKFVPYFNEGRDGYDSIAWAAQAPWSNGKVGTFGGSYSGRVQWLAALEQPPQLASMVAMVTPSDPFVEWPTGLPLPPDISWYHLVSGHVNQNEKAVDWDAVMKHLPLLTMDEAAGRSLPAWRDEIEHAQLDAFWEPLRYQTHYDKVQAPVLHISGWYDDEQIGTPLNFAGMVSKGPEALRAKQKLLMGPWPHRVTATPTKIGDVDFGPAAAIDFNGYVLRWFDATLKGIDNGIWNEPPMRIFRMGENVWTDEKEWPMARTQWEKYFLHSKGRANSRMGDGVLATAPPAAEPADKYSYDPADPSTFISEATFAQIGGPDDYRAVERRDDVLVYTTEAMTADRAVCGPIQMNLWAISSAKDTDFTAKLLDVWPNGFAQRLIDGMVRARFREGMDKPKLIEPGRAYAYTIDMWNTCQTFKKGHAIRVEISSSAFPKYDRNPNTGEPLGKGTRTLVAEQQVLHDKDHPSYVLLPVIPPK